MSGRSEKGDDFMAHIGNIVETYSLFIASIISLSLFAISGFYQLNFGKETHCRWFLVPAILFMISAALHALDYDGVAIGCVGAILLLIFTAMLYNIMMRVEK